MPCQGPSEYECRLMEAADNKKKFGKGWSDSEMLENVACAYVAFTRHKVPLPEWAVLWSNDHEEKDKQRKQREANLQKEKQDKDLREFNRLKKKLGL